MTDDAHRVLADARAARVFPAAVAEVGDSADVLWRDAFGTQTFDEGTPIDVHTPFDLASLTKVIATTTVVMHLVDTAALALDEPIWASFPEWRGPDRGPAVVRDLLEHSSGLAARLLDAPPAGRREFEHDICTMPLEYAPRTRSVYSDLGFILLGFLAADRGRAPLAAQFDALWGDPMLTFDLPAGARRRAAPTLPEQDDARRGRRLQGEVHDNYAAVLGAAGHAGLYGTVPAVGTFARTVLHAAHGAEGPAPFSAARVAEFTTRSAVPGSSRALGWDTMLPTSSCGTRMSGLAFGHVGYTGGSLWIDPARDRYFVLLTNRAQGGGSLDQMRTVRRAFHDALGDV
ncbi:MAG: serine hydrolase domain-containing protein [Vicinamibacterales bacterium]